MNEPLKNKMYHNVDIVCGRILEKRTSCANEAGIKSAVKWLKKEQDNLLVILCAWRFDTTISADKFADLCEKIVKLPNKAFEDVMKK